METKKDSILINNSYKPVYFSFEDPQFKIAVNLRFKIFVDEQNVPEDREIDGLDPEAIHFLIYSKEEKPIAVARIRFVGNKSKIERVGVISEFRGKGIGKILMLFIFDYIKKVSKEKSITEIVLGAQLTAIGFYEKLGFKCFGDVYEDAGIDHKDMSLELLN